jgi:hypothetical protein
LTLPGNASGIMHCMADVASLALRLTGAAGRSAGLQWCWPQRHEALPMHSGFNSSAGVPD